MKVVLLVCNSSGPQRPSLQIMEQSIKAKNNLECREIVNGRREIIIFLDISDFSPNIIKMLFLYGSKSCCKLDLTENTSTAQIKPSLRQ